MTDMWYNEVGKYTYGSDWTPAAGHFTQLVWASSKTLGCGVAFQGNSIYGVARYTPPGNVMGNFADNVFPPKF